MRVRVLLTSVALGASVLMGGATVAQAAEESAAGTAVAVAAKESAPADRYVYWDWYWNMGNCRAAGSNLVADGTAKKFSCRTNNLVVDLFIVKR
ncbi:MULTISPECIES: hypothetical protein [unclassified Streptomyces]|uniref:hypothetical protein n=1 Tax=unclassified Streptomyces TaxID=2593676 RepID=UPI0033E4F37A